MHKNAQYPLRMPVELREWLKVKSDENWRSLNAEIVAILREAYNKDNKKADCIRQDNQSATTSTQFTQGVNV